MKKAVFLIIIFHIFLGCDGGLFDNKDDRPEDISLIDGMVIAGKFVPKPQYPQLNGVTAYSYNNMWTFSYDDEFRTNPRVLCASANGEDIYLGGGYASGQNGYWKNGNFIEIDNVQFGFVRDILFSNTVMFAVADVENWYTQIIRNAGVYLFSFQSGNDELLEIKRCGELTDAGCIVLNGKDILVGGRIAGAPAYWDKDEIHNMSITDRESISGMILTMAVYEDDVYAGGIVLDHDDNPLCGYWKNSEWVPLETPVGGYVQSISVNDDGLFVGIKYDSNKKSGYWFNDIWYDLDDPYGNYFSMTSMAVDGTDVYVSGYSAIWDESVSEANECRGGYFKNSEWNELSSEVAGEEYEYFYPAEIIVK